MVDWGKGRKKGEGQKREENTPLLKLEILSSIQPRSCWKTHLLPAGLELSTTPKGSQDSGLRHYPLLTATSSDLV